MTNTQGTPIEDGHDDASFSDKVAGILLQVKADIAVSHETSHNPRELLSQRLADAGIEVTPAELDALVADIG